MREYWEESDDLEEDVLTIGHSDIYHFLTSPIDDIAGKPTSACGKGESFHTKSKKETQSITEIDKTDMSPCQDCVLALNKFTDVDVSVCMVCQRVDLIYGIEVDGYDIEHHKSKQQEVLICTECKSAICS